MAAAGGTKVFLIGNSSGRRGLKELTGIGSHELKVCLYLLVFVSFFFFYFYLTKPMYQQR